MGARITNFDSSTYDFGGYECVKKSKSYKRSHTTKQSGVQSLQMHSDLSAHHIWVQHKFL